MVSVSNRISWRRALAQVVDTMKRIALVILWTAALVTLFELSIFIAKPMAAMHQRSQDEDEGEGAAP